MSFVSTTPENEATGSVAELYEGAKATHGYVPNLTRIFSHRPEVYAAFQDLLAAIKTKMDPRRYELATLAAAQALGCSYCSLAHGSVLLRDHYAPDELEKIATDFDTSNLDAKDRAIMAFAQKVAGDATAVTESDIESLRGHGLSDTEIFDISSTVAARSFFTKTLDSLGARPDAQYGELADGLKTALTVGRPIDDSIDD